MLKALSWWRHLRLAHRLGLGYGAVIALLIGLSMVMEFRLQALSDTTADALQRQYPKTALVHEITIELGVVARAMRNVLILAEQDAPVPPLDEIEAAQRRMEQALNRLVALAQDPESRALLDKILTVHSAYAVNQEDFKRLVGAQRMGAARNLLVVDINGYQEDYFRLLDQLNRLHGARMLVASQEVEARHAGARRLVYSAAAVAVLLSLGVTWMLTRSVLRSLGGEPDYAARIARRIAAGELDCTVERRAGDDFSLLHDMDQMRLTLIDREQALQQANAELRHTVDQLSVAKDELVSSEKLAALGAMVAGVAHELNTPIGNSLLAASTVSDASGRLRHCVEQGITRKALADQLDEMAAAAELVQRNLHRAADLISSFKQVAVDRQSSQRRQFQLDQVIHEICLTLRPSLSKAKCQLDVTAAAGLVMDSFPGPLGQVLTNLVQNALLHGFEGRADARIWVEAQGLDAGHVQIVVRDNGVGVLPEHQGRVFDPFFTTRMGRGGTGLGLHICFNITTAVLGGKIRLTSSPGAGTTVVLVLPRRVPDLQPQRSEETDEHAR